LIALSTYAEINFKDKKQQNSKKQQLENNYNKQTNLVSTDFRQSVEKEKPVFATNNFSENSICNVFLHYSYQFVELFQLHFLIDFGKQGSLLNGR